MHLFLVRRHSDQKFEPLEKFRGRRRAVKHGWGDGGLERGGERMGEEGRRGERRGEEGEEGR